MATKLGIYNEVLRAIGDLRLTSLTEDTEARYVLDDAWSDAVEFCFTEGLWNFATKTEEISANTALTPIPGFDYAFDKPANWLRTITIAPDSNFSIEATYKDEGGKLYANTDTLYIRYISGVLASTPEQWPPAFSRVVSAYLAKECCERISGSNTDGDRLAAVYKDALASSKNKDAMDQSKMIMRAGNWVRAMRSGSSGRDSGPLSGY